MDTNIYTHTAPNVTRMSPEYYIWNLKYSGDDFRDILAKLAEYFMSAPGNILETFYNIPVMGSKTCVSETVQCTQKNFFYCLNPLILNDFSFICLYGLDILYICREKPYNMMFPSGHPSMYLTAPNVLDFSDRMRAGTYKL